MTETHNGTRITATQMHDFIDLCEEIEPGCLHFLSFHIDERFIKMSGQFMTALELHAAVNTAADLGGFAFTLWTN